MNDTPLKINPTTKLLLICGAIGPPFFIIAFLIEGATRLDYDSLRYPISSLSIGEYGWIQIINFILTGSLLIAFAIGLRRRLGTAKGSLKGPLLIGFVGIGLTGAGIFSTDPLFGYPADAPMALAQYTVHGHLHNLFSMLVFIGLPAACFTFRRRFAAIGEHRWALYSAFTGIAMPLFFILAAFGFNPITGLGNFGGIFQRLSVLIGWTWMALLAVCFLRTTGKTVVE